jgi:GNAT superfamily N-acetyltransferase
MSAYLFSPLYDFDQAWVSQFLAGHWGSAQIVTRGKVHQADRLPGFYARAMEPLGNYAPGTPVGLITYAIENESCEIVSLDSLVEGVGIGSGLLQQVEGLAREQGCRRLWLITSNDNTPAIRFYQKRGWRMAAIHRGAIDLARRVKPEIPWIGIDGIPIRDEIEFEKRLG